VKVAKPPKDALFAKNGLTQEQFLGMEVLPAEVEEHIMEVKGASYTRINLWKMHKDSLADSDELYSYILYMYDESTPLFRLYADLKERKRVAMELAGVEDKGTKKMILENKYTTLEKLAFEYLRYKKNSLWSLIISNENMFFECMEMMSKSLTADKDKDLVSALKTKSELARQMDETRSRLKKYVKEFYNDDEDLISQHNVLASRMSSESVADKLKK
jgi:hypothetical protein